MKYRYAFFDMDGTVIDSSPGIFNSIKYTAKKMGLELPDDSALRSFIGPPVVKSMAQYFNLPAEQAERLVGIYREYYGVTGLLECYVYEGIRELIAELSARGVICVLATCKPHYYANRILAHLGMDTCFAYVSGPEIDGTRNEKHEVIAHACEQLKISDLSSVLMIGDRDNDVRGASYHGIDCAGALWGFGSEEELRTAGAAHICATPADVVALFES